MMKPNDQLHGFTVRYVQELPEIHAVLYRMTYEKNGADLVWLDRNDDNKTFSITFKTIPQDDTGVFHILEHSVLNGSRKYPVKEPFVELLKSSLQTFLNAMTFSDKTMYPVSSRNDQDFLNLIDVYMDGVLHPLSLTDRHAFLQEGWHYELEDPEGELTCNGVVYNEMKGVYTDPDAALEYELSRALFPDNCYGFESGGHPDQIPTLTYENYLASHRRFYHPSNARIFLDGRGDLDAVLGKLDEYLRDYEYLEVDTEIPMQKAVHPAERIAEYEIDSDEDIENKVLMAKGWVIGSYSDREKKLTAAMLAELLLASNESPLKKALLEKGLCEDLEMHVQDDIQQPYIFLLVRNTGKEKREQVWNTVQEVLEQQARDGLDREQLTAMLNNLEFTMREQDYGSSPKGVVYAILTQAGWLYGGDPAQDLCYDKVCQSLRNKINTGWYEQCIREFFLENPHTAQVVLLPGKTIGQERRARETARLAAVKASWTTDECLEIIEEFHRLRRRQNEPDTPEQLASIPQLTLADIPPQPPEIAWAEPQTIEGVPVLREEIDTNGILYLTLYFSLADIPQEQLSAVSFLAALLGELGTERYSALQLRSQLEGNLGQFNVNTASFTIADQQDKAQAFLVVSVSALESRRDDILRLIPEVLLHTDFSDRKLIAHILRQLRLDGEQEISMSGNTFAARRIAASFSANGVVSEALGGITRLRWLQETEAKLTAEEISLETELSALCLKLISRDRLTINLTGQWDPALVEGIIAALPDRPMGTPVNYPLPPIRREGFQIASEIGFAARASNLAVLGETCTGAARVASQYLTLDYLWNAVRVQGGAYGTGLAVRPGGTIQFTSYRDPAAAQSLVTYMHAGDALRALADSGESLDRYIISTIGDFQSAATPRLDGQRAAANYFCGRTRDDRNRIYSEILHTTPEELQQFSHILDKACEHSGICVIAGRDGLDACGSMLDTVESIQRG